MNVNIRSLLSGSLARGVAIAAIVIATAFVGEWIAGLVGFNDPMAWMFPWAMVAVVSTIIFVESARPAALYVWEQVRPDYATGDGQHTTEEIALQASSVRRRHYTKQVTKTAAGALLAVLGAVNATMLTLHWERFYPTWQDTFGANAVHHYRFIVVLMAFMAVVGVGLAVRAWLNRYQNDDDALIQAMQELESNGGGRR